MKPAFLCLLFFALCSTGNASEYKTLSLPLKDGKYLTAGTFFKGLCAHFEIDAPDSIVTSKKRLDVSGIKGFLAVKTIDLVLGKSIDIQIHETHLAIRYPREKLRDIKSKLRTALAKISLRFLENEEAGAAVSDTKKYGLFPANHHEKKRPALVLVHGLDSGPSTFKSIITLLDDRFNLYAFSYRNDQAIARSAEELSESLAKLPDPSVLVCSTSMGGLVVRYYLCTEKLYKKKVTRLLMLAPPNHGSPFARVRIVLELCEAIKTLSKEEKGLKQAIALRLKDGLGQAGNDLTPGSLFLERLNRKPMPAGVTFGVVAGKSSLLTMTQHQALLKWLEKKLDAIANPLIKASFKRIIKEMAKTTALINGKGDLVVTLESARLKGAAFFKVIPRNHLTIDTCTPGSELSRIITTFFDVAP